MHAKGRRSEKLSIRMRNPRNRQLISIHVRIQFFDPCLRRFLTKNGIPLLKEPLRQLRNVFWVFNQIANPNSTHIAIQCSPNETEVSYRQRGRGWLEVKVF